MNLTKSLAGIGAVVLVAATGACGAASDSSLADHLNATPPAGEFSFGDAYGDEVTSVRIVCPYSTDAGALGVDEDEQAVIATIASGDQEPEVLERRLLDLCSTTSGEMPSDVLDRIDTATPFAVVQQAWSDGTSVATLTYY